MGWESYLGGVYLVSCVLASPHRPNHRRPRHDHRDVDLIFDGLPFGRLWYGEPNAIRNEIDYAQFISLSWFGAPCVLAIPPSPRPRRAQAKEEEAETL
jgi:hypothetical protein